MIFEAILCLAEMVYFEARSENLEDQVAVAYSAINRSELSGETICEVVHKPKRYSYYWDGKPEEFNNKIAYGTSLRISFLVYTGLISDPTSGSTHYHGIGGKPYWAVGHTPVGVFGAHYFYNTIGYSK